MNPVSPPRGEELVFSPAILILSQDLYPRKLEVVREYIQNASDAIDSFNAIAPVIEDTTESVIKVSIQGRSLLIFDNGIGMGGDDVAKLRYIAYSEKKTGEEAGYKGIGRLAGFAVAKKLKITSTCYGDRQLHTFEIRAQDMREEISQNKKRGVIDPASDVISLIRRTTTRLSRYATSTNLVPNSSTARDSRNTSATSLRWISHLNSSGEPASPSGFVRMCQITHQKPSIFRCRTGNASRCTNHTSIPCRYRSPAQSR